MTPDRKKPTGGFWITVALVAVVVAYPLGFGPACWITSRTNTAADTVPVVYRPVTWIWERCPHAVGVIIRSYATAASAQSWDWERGVWADNGTLAGGWIWRETVIPTFELKQYRGVPPFLIPDDACDADPP